MSSMAMQSVRSRYCSRRRRGGSTWGFGLMLLTWLQPEKM